MANVYFASSKVTQNKSLLSKIEELCRLPELRVVTQDEMVAVKTHFGDEGTTRFIRPVFLRKIIEGVKEMGGRPFATDTTTLYRGPRSNGVGYLELVQRNGFSQCVIGAPVVIADGITSKDVVEVPVNLKHFDTVKIASAAYCADSMVAVSHFKGHLAVGFGGAIKNLSMGLGSRSAKQRMHADVKPEFKDKNLCTGCGTCGDVCPTEAAVVVDGKAEFDYQLCIGCAECITSCPEGALQILWNAPSEFVQEKMVEVAFAAVREKRDKVLYFNFLLDVTPDCDCFPWSDNPIVPDIGVLASRDPVSIDQASADLVNAQPGLTNSVLSSGLESGVDKFRALHPEVDWTRQLIYGEEVGLGSRSYELIEI